MAKAKVMKQLLAAYQPRTITTEYELNGEKISFEVYPAVSLSKKQLFCEGVWSLYYAQDPDGNYDWRTFTYDAAVKYLTLAIFTNLDINAEKDFDKYYNLVLDTDLVDKVIEAMNGEDLYSPYENLVVAAREYIDRKAAEQVALQSALVASSQKHQIDVLLENLLTKATDVLDKVAADNGDIDVKEVMSALSTAKELASQDKLVDKVLDYEEKKQKKGGDTNGRHKGNAPKKGV